ncbi:hypothetical protein NECAME_06948 [Necator americanus]|uniref:Uncharacterized protein n=1 Tax=Necator americanus TaxID=51031 RepID=W2TQD9_NECAM|nr:hypothetical protein NECAME_06948 [Necator americanus]ETN84260.1 hypothetical protein NECAME_06948 [Necator americanus]
MFTNSPLERTTTSAENGQDFALENFYMKYLEKGSHSKKHFFQKTKTKTQLFKINTDFASFAPCTSGEERLDP